MGHNFKLTKQSLQKIDWLLPRLKHSVSPSKIIRWLENFDDKDVESVIDLLQVFEYITFDEILYRFNDLLHEILETVPIDDKIIILPYGKVGKSGSLITYPLKHTKAYKKREKKILLTHDFEIIDSPSIYNHIIFIDDFIGSGNTFHKEYKLKDLELWIKTNDIKNIYLLSSIIMKDGEDFISKKYPNIKIHAEVRNKIFDPINSPLKIFNKISAIRTIAYRYGSTINVSGFPPYIAPFGYDNSESLVSFFHSTPNNTLPIIWGKNKNWEPLFPRNPDIRMSNVRQFKKDIAFMIGICNRLGIDLYKNEEIIIIQKDGKRKRIIKYNTKTHHSIVALIRLKKENFNDIIICHILGLTMKELNDIYNEARKLFLVDSVKNLSINADFFIKELYEKTRKEKFRKETYDNLKLKNELYLPKHFKGLA